MRLLSATVTVCLLTLLTACGAPGPIMPSDRSTVERNSQARPSAYRVVRGDTLYSIAFRYGLDWREIAQTNNIPPPYTIRVGQNLELGSQSTAPAQRRFSGRQDPLPGETGTIGSVPRRVESRTISSASETTQDETSAASDSDTSITPNVADSSDEPTVQPSIQTEPAVIAAPSPNTSSNRGSRSTTPATDIQTSGNGRSVAGTTWFWPTGGQLARRFNANDTRKGIHIAGEQGQSIRATADGEVVYSGNGLIGYGELIIIKHSDSMLSAYAHNRQRLVEQGDRVSAGQRIASMGEFEPNRPLLHFEIRRNGQPDDPLKYLPPK
ncbi:MAG: peptidoglycan DD-metalloendopeptidase family protein [Pseudomonadota bacterium]